MHHPNNRTALPAAIVLFLLFLTSLSFSQLIITELQRDPAGSETGLPGGASHEFVEVTNIGIDTVMLHSLCLTDGVESDTVLPWPSALPLHNDCITGSTVLLPNQTALVLDRDYPAAVDSVPSSVLPIRGGTLLLTVGDAELGNGLANDDGMVIYKGTKVVIRRVLCFATDSAPAGSDPRAGKILLAGPQNIPEGISVVPVSFLFSSGSCYGACNDSLTPGSFELLKNNWFAEWRFGTPDTVQRAFACTLACLKSGALPHEPVSWSVIMQSPGTAVTAAQGVFAFQINRAAATFVLPLDSVTYTLCLTEQGAETVWPVDVSPLWTPASPLKINELFPRANAGEPEWFEIVNVSQMTINLKNWMFGNSEDTATVSSRDLVLRPGGFLVLTANAGLLAVRYPAPNRFAEPPDWHPLNNYNDTLCLWDQRRNLKERVAWRSEWFGGWSVQSLERVSCAHSGMDAASWVPAASPTPGQPNAAVSWRAGTRPTLEAGPLPFTPDGDGRNDVLAIIVDLPAGYTAVLSIYGFSGKKLRSFSGPLSHRIDWDGRRDNGSPAPVGPFFVVMNASSSQGSVTLRKRGVLWR